MPLELKLQSVLAGGGPWLVTVVAHISLFACQALDEFATKLIENEHYASDDVAARRDALLQRRNALYDRSRQRRVRLEESYKFQTFERDCDETKIWINEKLKAASDEGYLVQEWIDAELCICCVGSKMLGHNFGEATMQAKPY